MQTSTAEGKGQSRVCEALRPRAPWQSTGEGARVEPRCSSRVGRKCCSNSAGRSVSYSVIQKITERLDAHVSEKGIGKHCHWLSANNAKMRPVFRESGLSPHLLRREWGSDGTRKVPED